MIVPYKKLIFLFICIVLITVCMIMYYKYNYIYSLESKESSTIDDMEKYYDKEYDYDKIIDSGTVYSFENTSDNTVYNKDDNAGSKTNKDKDCIIKIPSINLKKIVYNGKYRDHHLKNYELVTATPDMKYSEGGNYIICGHASRLYGHSLNRLKEVKKGDIIKIKSSNISDEYKVYKVEYDNMYDTNKYCMQTNEQELTIISCAKYISSESYIVVKAHKK